MIKLVIFDMAGTVVDEQNVVYKTLHWALTNAGYQCTLKDVLKYGAGKEKLKAIQDLMELQDTSIDVNRSKSIYQNFKEKLDVNYECLNIKEQQNASKIFKWLKEKGIKVALNTGYNQAVASGLINKLNWAVGEHIDALVTATDVANHRPNPDMILLAMKQTQIINPSHVVKVGDSVIDIKEGQNANCLFSIGITTGAQSKEELKIADPSFIIDDLIELRDIIN